MVNVIGETDEGAAFDTSKSEYPNITLSQSITSNINSSNNNDLPDIDETIENYGDNERVMSTFTLDSNSHQQTRNEPYLASLEDL